MEPRIPDGSYCLFAGLVTGSRLGRTVLARMLNDLDPDTGQDEIPVNVIAELIEVIGTEAPIDELDRP